MAATTKQLLKQESFNSKKKKKSAGMQVRKDRSGPSLYWSTIWKVLTGKRMLFMIISQTVEKTSLLGVGQVSV